MYLIQFRLQFFVLIFAFIQEIMMIIKPCDCKPGRPQGGGGKSRPSPPLEKKVIWLYWGPFCYFFFICGPFCYVFLILGGLLTMWGPFRYFLLHFGGVPPSLRKFLRAPMIARRVREHAPWKFLCDHSLVSSGHVLLRFCLKNDKNNDKL